MVTVWPIWSFYAFFPLLVSAIHLVVNAACLGASARFLKVSLLHTFLLLQVRKPCI